MKLWTQIKLIVVLISLTWLLDPKIEVRAERRTFDFFKKHHHHHKHRKEDHHHGYYLDDSTDFDGYNHDSLADGHHHSGGHFPIVHIHTQGGGFNGYGIAGTGLHGGRVIHDGGHFGGAYFGSGIFLNDGLINNNLHVLQDEGIHHYGDQYGEIHGHIGNHGNHYL